LQTITTCTILLNCTGTAPVQAEEKTKAGAIISKTGSSTVSTLVGADNASNRKASLRRLDFRVVGSSCVKCLLQIQQQVGTARGIIKAAVQLQPPYAAAVVYDAHKTKKEDIFEEAKRGFPSVKFKRVEDVPLSSMPPVLIPKFDL
jgi:copper chaperone CopZ